MKKIHFTMYLLLFLLASKTAGSQDRALGAVATQHPLATQAAAQTLRKGGSAVDAAVATALILSVVEPYNSGLGGGGFALVFLPTEKKPHAVDFRETAPLAATPEMYQQKQLPEHPSRFGPLAVAVPGELAGLAWIHERWGKLPWQDLFGPALDAAEKGFKPDAELVRRIKEKSECLSRDYDSHRVYQNFFEEKNPDRIAEASAPAAPELTGSKVPKPRGNPRRFQQPELAKSLKRLRDGGVQEFYRGTLGQEMVSNLSSKTAILTLQDLQNYRVVEREALGADFPWGRLWGMPPPSSGGISVIHGMNLLEALSKKKPEQLRENWTTWLSAVLRILFQDRNTAMGDPDFASPLPVEQWIEKKQAKREAEVILKESSTGHTTHLSIIDANGIAVSMTLSLNLSFGSCVTAGTTGILMNDEMDDFTTHPGQPNAFGLVQSTVNGISPGKRPLSSMSPTLVTRDKSAILVLGSPGGPRIISSVLITLARYFLWGEDLRTAMAAPRIHYQGQPDQIFVERGAETGELKKIGDMGLPIVRENPWANVQAVSFDPKSGRFTAVSDPRGKGKALVVDFTPTPPLSQQ